jgi:hypothetical protein
VSFHTTAAARNQNTRQPLKFPNSSKRKSKHSDKQSMSGRQSRIASVDAHLQSLRRERRSVRVAFICRRRKLGWAKACAVEKVEACPPFMIRLPKDGGHRGALAHPESISNGVICGHSFAISDLAVRLLEREITSSNRKEIAACGGAAAESRLNSPLAVTASPSAFSKISLAPWRPSFVPRKARSRSPACGS